MNNCNIQLENLWNPKYEWIRACMAEALLSLIDDTILFGADPVKN